MKNRFFIIGLLLLAVFAISCDPEEINNDIPPTSQEALNAMEEFALVNKLFSDAYSETDAAARKADGEVQGDKINKNTYPIITIEPFDAVTWPKNVKVDYGETNFYCQDGRLRRGVINFETTGWYHEEGTVVTITFDDYYQNNHKVEGTQIVTNMGRNADENLVYSVVIQDGVVITSDNKTIYYEESTQREWIEGEVSILDPCDDVYLITGTQNGISSDEIQYNLLVQQALNVKVCCHYIRAGILDVNIQGLPTITINYGDGECNSSATITIMGIDYPIVME